MNRTYPTKKQIEKDLDDLDKEVVGPVMHRIRDYIRNLEDEIKELKKRRKS